MLFLYDGRLNELDLSIAKQIDTNPRIILENNIFDAADILGISPSKLTKYCQKIKLKGFKEIKYKIEDETKSIKYTEELTYNIDIKALISHEYFDLVKEVSALILSSEKIIIIADECNYSLANLLCSELRKLLANDVVCYFEQQEFDFEYLSSKPVTILIDQAGKFDLLSPKWYRIGNPYIHLTNEKLVPRENYYPISLANASLSYSFQIKVVMILAWIKNRREREFESFVRT